jgi:hypothetical protein
MDRFVLEDAQMTQIKAIYNKFDELSKPAPKEDTIPRGAFKDAECEFPVLLLNFVDLHDHRL